MHMHNKIVMVRRRSKAIKIIKKITDGVLSKAVDMVLVSIYFGLEFEPKKGGWDPGRKLADDLEQLNYETIKHSFAYLRRKGLVQAVKEKLSLPKITAQGRERLNSVLPKYQEKRIWDGRIYLITYDLPVKKNIQRNMLRTFLKKIGAGMLQKSVWLTPYNPKKLLQEFIEENSLAEDLILVSSLGKDGTVGEIELSELMDKVYHLSEINLRYREFLFEIKNKRLDRSQLVFRYLSILKDDPQLPFELLPKDWVGEEAYFQFKNFTK